MKKGMTVKGMTAGLCLATLLSFGICGEAQAADAGAGGSSVESASFYKAQTKWVYKEENGKKYMRLYDGSNGVWLTDWILIPA